MTLKLSIVDAPVEPQVRPHPAPGASTPSHPKETGGRHAVPQRLAVLTDATVVSVDLQCAVPGCGITASPNTRGHCQPHADAFLTRAYELTWEIGRGTHE